MIIRLLILSLFILCPWTTLAEDKELQDVIGELAEAEAQEGHSERRSEAHDEHDDKDDADHDEDEDEDFDEEEEEAHIEVTEAMMRQILERHFPERLELLELLREEEPHEFREMQEESMQLVEEHLHLTRELGRRAGITILDIARGEQRTWELAERINEAGGAERDRVLRELKSTMARTYDLITALDRAHLRILEAEVEEMRDEIDARRAERNDNIRHDLAEMMEEFGEDEYEDDEEEEEDEEEEDE
jgi:hypothetical protein